MRLHKWFGVLTLVCLYTPVSAIEVASLEGPPGSVLKRLENLRVAQRSSCKAMSSCEEAVQAWCDGYSGADRDKDGIPCENVCRSKAQVDAIKERIGC